MTPAKLRAWAETVIADYDCEGTDCDCDRPKYATLARAALALAELMPALQALRSARYQDTMHGGGCREVSAVSSVLYALDRAEESLQ